MWLGGDETCFTIHKGWTLYVVKECGGISYEHYNLIWNKYLSYYFNLLLRTDTFLHFFYNMKLIIWL